MARTTGDIIVEKLIDWGVDTAFGMPGDGINGIFEALRKNRDKIRFIQVRHEEAAALMACGYAKYTGRLGVCFATSGPGAIHLLNGLYDAKMDHAPVLAVTGQTYHDMMGTQYQQEVDLISLFKDVAEYNIMVLGANQAAAVVDIACRSALSSRSVSHITCPVDIQDWTPSDTETSMKKTPGHTSSSWRPPIAVPQAETIKSASEVLNAGTKVAILCGAGALHAGDELEKVADQLGAPILKALLGKAAVPDDSPYCTGGIGLLGTLPSEMAMEECDTLFMVGTSFPYQNWYPKMGQARCVQIDHEPARIGLRYPVDVGLCGDTRATLQALIPMLRRNEDRSFLDTTQKRMAEWRELMKDRESRDDTPLKPQVVAGHVNELLEDGAIISTDSGTITTWAARHIHLRRGMQFTCSGNLATMAPALPYAIAAKAAYPDRQSVAFIGDGGFSMLMAEFATAVKHELPIVVVVIKNDTLGQIKWEQIVFLGNPEYEVALHPIDFVKFAEACGGIGFRCETPEQVRPALEMAFKAGKPALVEAVVDPYEPPMPPRATPKQAMNFARALVRGQPERGEILSTVIENKIKELV